MKKSSTKLFAGADSVDITPVDSLYLAGYPFVSRMSTGVHDPLLSAALFLSDGKTGVLFIADDLIFVGKESAARVRAKISEITGVPEKNIMVTATHTHSGPSTVTFTAGSQDPLLPEVNAGYVHVMEQGMIKAACNAFNNAVPAELGMAVADATGVGTNRNDPAGPSDLEVPVLFVRNSLNKDLISCMMVCSMHPTVLHEDSTLYSGDFPGLARLILQNEAFANRCPVLYHIGAAGNQSPRHVTKENTFQEAHRIGNILAQAVKKSMEGIEYSDDISINAFRHFTDLPKRRFPGIAEAKKQLESTARKLQELKDNNGGRQKIRTAEVNWFGAVESLHLSELAQTGSLQKVYETCLPAEIQVFEIGPWKFIGWPGEVFIEYALAIRKTFLNAYIITLANGELQGYIVTKEAFELGGYEASNAIFDYKSGEVLVSETIHLLKTIQQDETVSGN
jgi:hypothetical protein